MINRSNQLDLLRTIAILLVFTSHFNTFAGDKWFAAVGQFGWIGVDLFFVLSGFLIASQLLKPLSTGQGLSFKEFYIRRGLRIWPNFFFVLCIYLFVPGFKERSELAPLWKFLTFTQNFNLDFRARGAFSHAWSLCVEEQFYLALPFILLVFTRVGNARRIIITVLSVMVFGVIIRGAMWFHFIEALYNSPTQKGLHVPFYREIYYPTYCRLDGLLIGVSIATVFRLRPALWQKIGERSNMILVLGVATLVTAISIVLDEYSLLSSSVGYLLIDIAFGLLTIAALSPMGVFSKLKIPGVQTSATLAFAFYLTHKQMIHLSKGWLLQAGVSETSLLYPIGIFAVCSLTALALYYAVERPFLKLRDRMLCEKSHLPYMESKNHIDSRGSQGVLEL